MATAPAFLAVDGGATKTAAVLVDEHGQVLARASTGPSNLVRIGVEAWSEVIATVVTALRQQLAQPFTLARAWIGTAGIHGDTQVPDAHAAICKVLGLDSTAVRVTSDAALLSAGLRGPGMAVIAGTGSVVHGFVDTPQGPRYVESAGGLGWILGDEGSAFGVGRAALRCVLSGEAPALCAAVLSHYAVDTRAALLNAVYAPGMGPERIASLAPVVFSLALDEGDAPAHAVMQEQAAALADQIARVASALDAPTWELVFGGSVVQQEAYRAEVMDALRRGSHTVTRVTVVTDAAAWAAQALRGQAYR
ncbi:hypothetical protein MBRA1_001135 [Malassezia brasiliensis]|uniref:N-acetyl-D-glucosamine kinase n=1 Tax=Malassezia brasiliensis TaxID=1821822 RepID=A0AAF0DR07_9BASI|nr:hypothetical protein MBRA1_001135 [Malassezia brasiliensis]